MERETTFGDWLQRRLERRGWQQADLHHATGISRGLISAWVRGAKLPDSRSARRIAAALELEPEEVLYAAGHLPALPRPAGEYERLRTLRELERLANEGLRRIEEVRVEREESPVPYYGRVPADAVRWIASREDGAVVAVWDRLLAGRSPHACLVVTASGDCLARRGIPDGALVLLEWARGRAPGNGQIVLIRFGDEYALKCWYRDGDWIELRDGEGRLVRRFALVEEFEVVALFVAAWITSG